MRTFFFEILSEEIPAKMQKSAINKSKEVIGRILKDIDIHHEEIYASCTTRRLCICVTGVDEEHEKYVSEKRGPRIDAPRSAIDGFLRSNNLTNADLIEDGGYFCVRIEHKKQQFIDQIPDIVSSFVRAMSWPKSMYWYNHQTHTRSWLWVRPVRSVLCLWDSEPVVFNIDGWGITTGNVTYHKGKPFIITSFSQYKNVLKDNFVIVDYNERQQAILDACETEIKGKGVSIKYDASLLDEMTGLVDYPFVVVGDIDKSFMHLPADVLSTLMKVHQKYFSTITHNGEIAPFFIAISNCHTNETVRLGFEKVLRARLSDAAFFYYEDLKSPLEENIKKLDNIVFHEKLGTLGQKVNRLRKLVPEIDRAALLCKLDLVSNMVGEFDVLQGIMGAHYAAKQGETTDVVNAIAEHYKGHNSLPCTSNGARLALADKVDTLVGFFCINIMPTGSKDPFALRRAALGIIRISLAFRHIDLNSMINLALANYSNFLVFDKEQVFKNIVTFIYERLAVYFKEQKSIQHDIIRSVLSFGEMQANKLDIFDLHERAMSIQAYFESGENDFMQLFDRVHGLLSTMSLNANCKMLQNCCIRETLFQDTSEIDAYNALTNVMKFFATIRDSEKHTINYTEAIKSVATLKGVFDVMFDSVQINCEDATIRNNRLALLANLWNLYAQIANFVCFLKSN
ncbi:MAG: glycine--tRNA ligase subunit beta [Holosporales bacterium]|nr:glycine--tRNA ligase subunit beta [Holosporales bacterium]